MQRRIPRSTTGDGGLSDIEILFCLDQETEFDNISASSKNQCKIETHGPKDICGRKVKVY